MALPRGFRAAAGNETRRKKTVDQPEGRGTMQLSRNIVCISARLQKKPDRGVDPVLQENKAVNIGNTIHWLVLHSPLDVTEFHSHSDALAPDHGKRESFSSGTSVSYNYIDYRFRNNTDRDIQLLLWCADKQLYGELCSERALPCRFELVEEAHIFIRREKNITGSPQFTKTPLKRRPGPSSTKGWFWTITPRSCMITN